MVEQLKPIADFCSPVRAAGRWLPISRACRGFESRRLHPTFVLQRAEHERTPMSYIAKMFNNTKTSQTVPILGAAQVAKQRRWIRFQRRPMDGAGSVLDLWITRGTYYAAGRALTLQNAERVLDCLEADGLRVVERIVEISREGRAPKNEPALFALALAAKLGNQATRTAAFAALPAVARIGTHLFTFAEHIKVLGGWARGTTRAFARWYTDMDPKRLAFQAVKYQTRVGWSHRDLLRKAHPKAQNDQVTWETTPPI